MSYWQYLACLAGTTFIFGWLMAAIEIQKGKWRLHTILVAIAFSIICIATIVLALL